MKPIDLLKQEAARLGVSLDSDAWPKFEAYLALLAKWSKATNVVGTADPDELVRYHLADSLVPLLFLDGVSRLVDVGAGGGFPGAVLAIARGASLEVTSLEPIHKKHAFLATLRRELSLSNFTPLAQRDEEHRSHVDLCPYQAAISRATWAVPAWLEHGAALVEPGGLVLAMEGKDQAPLPPGATRHPYTLGDRTRAIVTWSPPAQAGGSQPGRVGQPLD